MLAELLLLEPLLQGSGDDDAFEQISLITKNIGAPSTEEVDALGALCRIHPGEWLDIEPAEKRTQGNLLEMKILFLGEVEGKRTVEYLRGFLKWDPRGRWNAEEALGRGGGDVDKTRAAAAAAAARIWWEAAPRACTKEAIAALSE